MRRRFCLRQSDLEAGEKIVMEIDANVIVSLLTLAGTILTVISGSKLTAYRLQKLEEKVQAHNNLIERMYEVEKRVDVDENRIKVSEHRIDDLEKRGVE